MIYTGGSACQRMLGRLSRLSQHGWRLRATFSIRETWNEFDLYMIISVFPTTYARLWLHFTGISFFFWCPCLFSLLAASLVVVLHSQHLAENVKRGTPTGVWFCPSLVSAPSVTWILDNIVHWDRAQGPRWALSYRIPPICAISGLSSQRCAS